MAVKVRILEALEEKTSQELRQQLEEGIGFLYMAAQWGADSHPFLWAAIQRAKELLGLEEEEGEKSES